MKEVKRSGGKDKHVITSYDGGRHDLFDGWEEEGEKGGGGRGNNAKKQLPQNVNLVIWRR